MSGNLVNRHRLGRVIAYTALAWPCCCRITGRICDGSCKPNIALLVLLLPLSFLKRNLQLAINTIFDSSTLHGSLFAPLCRVKPTCAPARNIFLTIPRRVDPSIVA
jgi:hypothetical protein